MANKSAQYKLQRGWQVLLKDLGINLQEVLILAELPRDIFVRDDVRLNASQYFRFWNSLELVSKFDDLPLRIGQSMSLDVFDPPMFASICSPNLNIGLQRLAYFKRLIAPIVLEIKQTRLGTCITLKRYDSAEQLSQIVAESELFFLSWLARIATRCHVVPLKVQLAQKPLKLSSYEKYFGTPISIGKFNQIVFSQADTNLPFLTEDAGMWNFFEPALRKRLSELSEHETFSSRTRSALLELIPAGQLSIADTAKKLAFSQRSLQRQLQKEGTTFQNMLRDVRVELATHYLKNSSISLGEISFLLGFQESNSFIRAFSEWMSITPGEFRKLNIA
jgi:AraC-like DNA-binding protein